MEVERYKMIYTIFRLIIGPDGKSFRRISLDDLQNMNIRLLGKIL